MKPLYEVRLTSYAERGFSKLPPNVYRVLRGALLVLAENPRPPGCKKLRGRSNQWRIRRGDYRIIYEVEDAVLRVLVVEVGKRDSVYE